MGHAVGSESMRAGMPADQDEVRGCLTVFAADEAPWVVESGIG